MRDELEPGTHARPPHNRQLIAAVSARRRRTSGYSGRRWRAAAEPRRSGGHAAHVRQNAALTSFAAWFGNALRAAEPGCFTCHGGHQAFGLPSPAQVSAALGIGFDQMAKAGNEYQEIVGAVVKALDPSATVRVSQWIEGPDGRRDMDVEVRGTADGQEHFILVECKDWTKPVGTALVTTSFTWVRTEADRI